MTRGAEETQLLFFLSYFLSWIIPLTIKKPILNESPNDFPNTCTIYKRYKHRITQI